MVSDSTTARHGRERLSSIALFAWAGGILSAVSLLCDWRPVPVLWLPFVLAAMLLGLLALARSGKGGDRVKAAVKRQRTSWTILLILVVVHSVLAVYFCRISHPVIDTYAFQRDACHTLLTGVDPYSVSQTDLYLEFSQNFYSPEMVANGRVLYGFSYPPVTLFWLFPGYFLGDVRYSYILAMILSGVLVFAANPSRNNAWAAAALLLNPLTFYVEVKCYTEPLALMLICAAVFTAKKHPRWLALIVGLFLASKQYNVLALPFLGGLLGTQSFSWKAYWRLAISSCAIATATLAPFALWDFRGLWRSLVLFQLALPFRNDALSFAVIYPILLRIGPVVVLLYAIWAVRVGKRNPGFFVTGFGLAVLIFFSTSKHGFCNFYFLAAQMFFLYSAVLPKSAEQLHAGLPEACCAAAGGVSTQSSPPMDSTCPTDSKGEGVCRT